MALHRLPEGRIRLCVEDDGVGPAQQTTTSTGIGRLIIDAMAEKLGAILQQDGAYRGTRVVLEFPDMVG